MLPKREIVVGSTDEKEIKDNLGWFWENYYEDKSTFPIYCQHGCRGASVYSVRDL